MAENSNSVLFHVLPIIPVPEVYLFRDDIERNLWERSGKEIWQYQVKLIDNIVFNLKVLTYVASNLDVFGYTPPEIYNSCEQVLNSICAYELSKEGLLFRRAFMSTYITSRTTVQVFPSLYEVCRERVPNSLICSSAMSGYLSNFGLGRTHWNFLVQCIVQYLNTVTMDPIHSRVLMRPLMNFYRVVQLADCDAMENGLQIEYINRFGHLRDCD